MRSFGDHLRQLREEKSLSVAEVAKKAGIPVSTYREWEYGRAIRGEPYAAIARALGVSLEVLFRVEPSDDSPRLQDALNEAREIERRSKNLIQHLSLLC